MSSKEKELAQEGLTDLLVATEERQKQAFRDSHEKLNYFQAIQYCSFSVLELFA